MSPKTIWSLILLVVCVYPLSASTYYVGTCKSGSFPTISAAVNSASVAPGSTIKICAGSYSEQVIISKDLTLQGLNSSTASGASGALINPPTSMQTTTSAIGELNYLFGPIAPVVWVTAGTVNIQNVSVISDDTGTCTARSVGFYYATGASGTLNHVGFISETCGVGIWAENADLFSTSVTVENSYSAAGIVAGSLAELLNGTLNVRITGNQVFPTAPDGAFGIYLYAVSGTVENNFVSGPRWYSTSGGGPPAGLAVTAIADDGVAQTNVTISGNTIQLNDNANSNSTSWGILIFLDGATVKSNKISGPAEAIGMLCHNATVSGNTISFAVNGLVGVPAGFTGMNSFYNTLIKTSGGC
jgi:hypothetical protein